MCVSIAKSMVTFTCNINLVEFFSNSASMPKLRITSFNKPEYRQNKVPSVREVCDTVLGRRLLRLIQLHEQVAPLTLPMA